VVVFCCGGGGAAAAAADATELARSHAAQVSPAAAGGADDEP